MQKLTKTIFVAALALMAGGAFADEWSPIGIEWGFGWLPQEDTNVYGLRLGLMCGNHTVRGVGISVADVSVTMFKSNQGGSFKSVGLVVRLRMASPFPSRLWRRCMRERRVGRLAGSIFQNVAAGACRSVFATTRVVAGADFR